jgi:Protein kinase domain
MTPEQQRRVRDLFEAALDRDHADARGWLAAAAADDPVVRAEVLSLFDHHTGAGRFLMDSIGNALPELLEDDEPLTPGATIGSYTIVRELGRGGMGRVYLASDEKLRRKVALKALPPHLVGDPRQRERLRREARAAAALTHPGICTVYALEEFDGVLYIATEFVDGHTLRDEIRSGARPSEEDVLRTARELADALAFAHAGGVVHRDLKPENVMRTAGGRLKILDFGLARIDPHAADAASYAGTVGHEGSRAGTVLGTPAYMAPEQINGQPVDARADIFAFGVLLYEYASGTHPFHASTPLAMVAHIVNSEAVPLSSTGVAAARLVDHVIKRCLHKSPADRYASGAGLVDALGRVGDPARAPKRDVGWWRIHQLAIIALYAGSSVLAWLVKAWVETPITVMLFLALGALSTTGGVLRGHLLFTEQVNRGSLGKERRRVTPALRLLDLIVAALLVGDGLTISGRSALAAVIALSLGLGIAAANLVLEPSTTAAAFGDDAVRS